MQPSGPADLLRPDRCSTPLFPRHPAPGSSHAPGHAPPGAGYHRHPPAPRLCAPANPLRALRQMPAVLASHFHFLHRVLPQSTVPPAPLLKPALATDGPPCPLCSSACFPPCRNATSSL